MDFYYSIVSAPCRAVLMTAKTLGIELNLEEVNLSKGEHRTPEYAKINPQQTIPALVDDGFSLWESRAIIVYLAEKYGKTDSLYPKNPKQRAVINQRLYFDMGTLYQSFSEYYYPQVFAKAPADPVKFKKMEAALDIFETILNDHQYAAGDSLTVADISLFASVSNYEAVKFDMSKYPKVANWYKQCQSVISGIELNQSGAEMFGKFFSSLM